jgi:xanthine dehydrogenase small subunit
MTTSGSSDSIRFLLNGTEVAIGGFRCDRTLLDYLRNDRVLTGTKEGCAEGDCGACTVLVGRVEQGALRYDPVNACIRFLGSLHGCHVVTIEHVAARDGALHAIQQAMVDAHGSQCGFCTPGIVMALYALWMNEPEAGPREIERGLQGNLCRCTGYEPIVQAAQKALSAGGQARDALIGARDDIVRQLAAMMNRQRITIEAEGTVAVVPGNLDDLAAIIKAQPEARIIAGATDVGLWVTKHFRDVSPAVFIGHLDEMKTIDVEDNVIRIGAGVSYAAAHGTLAAHIPALGPLIDRIGGPQVRAMGTIGGNIANGSPIGDTPPPLIALGADVVLRHGDQRRSLPLQDFFVDYGKQNRGPGEFVEAIRVPVPRAGEKFAVYKVSKRRDEDITAVLVAIWLRMDGERIADVRIACGGMAATPKRAPRAEAALKGERLCETSIRAAIAALDDDFSPLSDWRASANYRMTVAKNLLMRFWLENGGSSQPATVTRRLDGGVAA